MARRARPLTQQDREAWAAYARTVRALDGREGPLLPKVHAVSAPPAEAGARAPLPPPPPPRRCAPPPPLLTGIQPPGLDNATWSKFRGNKLAAARTLDLHGKTVQAAFHALERFLLAAYAEQVRCVEIITGRGSGEGGGAIRRELPMWLNLPRLRPLVLACAHPHAANAGSFRVLIRRKR